MNTDQQTLPAKKFGLLNIILVLVLTILLCGEAYFGYRLDSLSRLQEQIKEDYSTLNNITFGLFSVDQWRNKISAVVNGQVTDFSMSRQQQKALQRRARVAAAGGGLDGLQEVDLGQRADPMVHQLSAQGDKAPG